LIPAPDYHIFPLSSLSPLWKENPATRPARFSGQAITFCRARQKKFPAPAFSPVTVIGVRKNNLLKINRLWWLGRIGPPIAPLVMDKTTVET
jgi:hypothetical protein